MVFSQQEARDMRDALELLNQTEGQAEEAANQVLIAQALSWWNTVKPQTPRTRPEAVDAFNIIKRLIQTETDRHRQSLLRKKLTEANEKFKEIKRNE